MEMEVLFAGVRVRSLEPAAEWWARLFGRRPDIIPDEDEVMWRVADAGWLYLRRDPSRAGAGLVTICVADLEATVAELAQRGVAFGPIAPVGDAAYKSLGADPEGNAVELIQVNT